MADLKIPEGEISALLSKAILDQLSEATRDRLVSDAISYLLTKKDTNYYTHGPAKTPLQDAFESAMMTTARDIAEEVLNLPENRSKIVAEYSQLIEAIPSFADDWNLQVAFMQAIIKRAQEIKGDA